MGASIRSWLRFTEEVETALAERRAVVALESTLLTHGLPADRADEVAETLEVDVRAEGAVPATIAAMDGRFAVGLGARDRARFLEGSVQKASRRDLSAAVVRGGLWSTTVAATATIAYHAGIRLFATGGIGGVHRGAERSFDESADLTTLSRVPIAVVSAGVKAVLDLPRTMERLETLGVPVVGYRCAELPAFYHPRSGVSLTARADSPGDVAAFVRVQLDALGSGLLVVQPPPRALAPTAVERWIDGALAAADREGIHGSHVTPYLLNALRIASAGEVVDVNIALVRANAALAARVAVADRAGASLGSSST